MALLHRLQNSCLPLSALAVALAMASVLLLTSPMLPMTWDEGDSLRRAAQIGDGRWEFTTEREGHPAGYGILIGMGWWLADGWLPPLTAARLGPILLFAAATGTLFYCLAKDHSWAAGMGGAAALMLLPRVFAHAHIAGGDGPLTACWILTWAAFGSAREGCKGAVFWGALLGLTLSMKATGWLAPVPFMLWAALYRDRLAARAFVVGVPVALGVFFLMNPPLWQHPIGWVTFFRLNLGRADEGLNISTWFLGHMYNLDHPLPWYNTLLWTAITVPLGLLSLVGIGLVAILRRPGSRSTDVLILFNGLILLVVRALPSVPVHDGVRLFLPSFAFLAAIAGIGVHEVLQCASRHGCPQRRPRALTGSVLLLLYAVCSMNVWLYAPQWLSYYSILIGGLPGAVANGMEPTYWWDAFDDDVLHWLHTNTDRGEKIRFGAASPENLRWLNRWDVLRRGWHESQPGPYRWYVIQHRPSAWQPHDWWLLESARPAYRKTLLGVPLLSVYEYDDFVRLKTSAKAYRRADASCSTREHTKAYDTTTGSPRRCISFPPLQ